MHHREVRRNAELKNRGYRYEMVVNACQALFAQGVAITYRAIASWLGLKETYFYQSWVQPSSLVLRVVYNYRKLQMSLLAT